MAEKTVAVEFTFIHSDGKKDLERVDPMHYLPRLGETVHFKGRDFQVENVTYDLGEYRVRIEARE